MLQHPSEDDVYSVAFVALPMERWGGNAAANLSTVCNNVLFEMRAPELYT
jgi:hypothetical protein